MARIPGIDGLFAVLQGQTEALAALPTAVTALTGAVRQLGEVVGEARETLAAVHRLAVRMDALRRNGWKGFGPVPWSHEPNRGFLRALYALGRAAEAIGEVAEAERVLQFLDDSDPAARAQLGS